MAKLSNTEIQEIQTTVNQYRSKRMRILKALELILATIDKNRGYASNIIEVSFDVALWRDKSNGETPIIFIVDDTTNITRHAGCVREYAWRVRLFGVVRDADIIDFEEHIADVETCLYDNNTLAGQVAKVEVDEIITDNQLFSELEGTHLYEMILSIEYTRNARVAV